MIKYMIPAILAHKTGQALRSLRVSNMVNRLFYTRLGQIIISILFGLSLALLFHRACKGDQCVQYVAPASHDVEGKTFRNGQTCYEYDHEIVACEEEKKKEVVAA